MPSDQHESSLAQQVERVLGYLNFSSGTEDPIFLRQLDEIFRQVGDNCQDGTMLHELVHHLLADRLKCLAQSSAAFADCRQAEQAIDLVFRRILPAYLQHHGDLLFHRGPESLFNSFFVGRAFEVALLHATDLESAGDPALAAVAKLNDYIGHRPVAVLESQKLEPYEREWVRPIPVYIRRAGVACGPYEQVVRQAIDLLSATDEDILQQSQFDPQLLDELAIDPRAFDFEHPVNKRPNHHFGQWDEHHIDNRGNYRRFVIHQVTLDALLARVTGDEELPSDQLALEAAAVLAGTILMAAGICGHGPGAHDSTVTLGSLLPQIAAYRDKFYERLLRQIEGGHQKRLIEEARRRHQPFGAARQHLNRQLARHRAFQMIHVQLALIFARMGYGDAALRHANVVPVASARMICQIECGLFSGQQALDDSDLPLAVETVPRLFDLLQRGVECGAIIDPWNIIGFDANYSLFQGNENVVRDHRADELVSLMEQVFAYSSQVWIAAEAADNAELSKRIRGYFDEIVTWWRKYAVHEVSSIESPDPLEIFRATENVAKALNLWHKSGAEAGNVEFWATHAKLFDSPKAYILAIECLIDCDDFVTSMALLIHWLGQSATIPLHQGSRSFQEMVALWIGQQRTALAERPTPDGARQTWKRVRKFCDYIEANAGEFWSVPVFELSGNGSRRNLDEQDLHQPHLPDENEDLFRAAYEGMVYRDTTDDGMDSPIYDGSDEHSDEALQSEVDRIADRLDFLDAIASYWLNSALLVNSMVSQVQALGLDEKLQGEQQQRIDSWATQAETNATELDVLVKSIQAYHLPESSEAIDSLAQYDRHRLFKETLLDQAIHLSVETNNAGRILRALSRTMASIRNGGEPADDTKIETREVGPETNADDETQVWTRVLATLLQRDVDRIRELFPELLNELADKPLLYVPLSKGGDPLKIVATRVRQFSIHHLLANLPQMGLLEETCELIQTTLMMERNQTVRQGAVTEFDELFRTGYMAMVQSIIDAAAALAEDLNAAEKADPREARQRAETVLFDCLEMLTETMLLVWLSHSQTLRLSVLEKVRDQKSWEKLVDFVSRFGHQLFTQQFLSLSNIRAILHQGVESWLTRLQESDEDYGIELIVELNNGYPKREAVRHVSLVLESIIENFNEYRDYNCTTTQSDQGDLIHVLLNFLRLRCKYDQVCWNLKPVIWTHELLVRCRQNNVARLWRRLLTERVSPEADRFVGELQQLQEEYSIQMATIGQRMNERFVHSMHVDRLISLVDAAMRNPRSTASQRAFELIEHHAESMTQQPIGVGFELPTWLTALDDEVERVYSSRLNPCPENSERLVEPMPLGIDQLREQLERLPRREGS